MTKHHKEKNPQTSGEGKPPANQAGNTPPIARTIIEIPDSVVQEYRTNQKENQRENKINRRIAIAAVVGAWIYAAIAVFQWCEMRAANRETTQTLHVNERAFLYCQSVTITGGNAGEQNQHYVYQVFSNSGLTQARRVKASFGISEAKGVTNVQYEMPETKSYMENNDTRFNIIPTKETGGVVTTIDGDVVDRLQHLTSGLIVYGTIRYCDIFGDPHVTRYCRKLVDIRIDSRTGDKVFDFGGCVDQSHACDDEDCPNGQDTPQGYCR
jgi:hypothetical protein